MPHKRKPENRKLPARWVHQHGAYYYLAPPDLRHLWDGKTWFRLGATLTEAYRTWTARVGQEHTATTTIDRLLDRYLLEELPKKAAKTQTDSKRMIERLRLVFADVRLEDIEPQHIYQYVDKRTGKVAAKREVEILSHAYTKAVQWGLLKSHPFKGEVRLEGNAPRTRYIDDWELAEVMAMPQTKAKGGVGMIQAYIRLKLLTGLRQRDLLQLTVADCKPDGIHVTPSKTSRSTGKKLIYEWTDELRQAYDQTIAIRPALSPYLFCNRYGHGYVTADGSASSFASIWQRFMTRVLAETNITERFTEHDLRAKVGSDADNLERAKQLLAHSDSRMTQRVYRRKAEIIQPAGGKKLSN